MNIKCDEQKDLFVERQIKFFPNANKDVLYFIADFLYHNIHDIREVDHVLYLFRAGYCYYFAIMLKTAFNRGTICWAAPHGHIVWRDENGISYDIEGVNISDIEEYIPIEYIGNAINDFRHVRGIEYNITDQEIASIILKYQEQMRAKASF